MNAPGKITLFATGLTAAFGVAAYAGTSIGPVVSPAHPALSTTSSPLPVPLPTVPAGRTAARHGYAPQPVGEPRTAGVAQELRFVVTRPVGHPLTDHTTTHHKPLHLIVAGRDLIEFHHVHPLPDEDGTWSVGLVLSQAVAYRVFADFRPGGREDSITLGADR